MNYNEIFHMSLLTEVTLKFYTGMEDKIISSKGLCMLASSTTYKRSKRTMRVTCLC